MSTKRKKVSGLSGIELLQTVQAIGGLLAKWQAEQAEQVNEVDEVDAEDRTTVDQLQTVLEMLKKKIDGPQVCVSQTCRKS